MEPSTPAVNVVRFGLFEADLGAGELRKRGRRVPLQEQPFQVLVALLRRRGEIVTREELQQAIWPADTFIEFEHGINTAIKKIRQALDDSADNPRFIETLPRKGYRFIAPVEDLTDRTTTASPASAAEPAPVVPQKPLRRWRWWAAGAAVIVIAAGCALWLVYRPGGRRVAAPLPVPLTSYLGQTKWPSFSPDGERVTFAWDGGQRNKFHIYVKQIGEEQPVRLTGESTNDMFPAWSPDGRWIAFMRALPADKRGVFLIPAIGGTERKLTEVSEWRIAWHPGGGWLAVSDSGSAQEPLALFLVSTETGEKRRLTKPPGETGGDYDPAFSPDGRAVVFARSPGGMSAELFLLEMSQDRRPAGEPRRITSLYGQADEPAWWPDGSSIVFAEGPTNHDRALWELAVRGRSGGLEQPERLPFGEGSNFIHPAISRQGRIAYMRSPLTAHLRRLELGGAHEAANMPMNSTRLEHVPQYSPDGNRIAFASNRSGSHEIWLCDADGSNVVKLTSFGWPYVANPAWSPDGRRIAFDAQAKGTSEIYIISSDGGKPERLAGSQSEDGTPAWSRDGKWIYISSARSGKPQLWKILVEGGTAVQVTRQGGGGYAVESPDGRYVHYLRSACESEITEIWRAPVEGGEETRVAGDVAAQFISVTGRGVYFFSDWDNPKVQCYNFASKKVETVGKVEGRVAYGMSVSPDNRYLLYSVYGPQDCDLMLVEGYRP